MKLNKAYLEGLADAQVKPYAPPVSINKNVVKKLRKRRYLSTPVEKLKVQSVTPRRPDEPESIVLGDLDPTKWRWNDETKTVIFSFPGYEMEMAWLTAHQLSAQIGAMYRFPRSLDASL